MRFSSLFEFYNADFYTLLARFGLLLLGLALIIYLVALIILQLTKNKEHKIGFRNWFKICFMYGIIFGIAALGVCVVLIIRSNGLYYFAPEALSWTLRCGYILMWPEIVLTVMLITSFFMLRSSIYKTIK